MIVAKCLSKQCAMPSLIETRLDGEVRPRRGIGLDDRAIILEGSFICQP